MSHRCLMYVLCAFCALLPLGARAQIPVTDAASISNSARQQAETLAKWKLQYDQMTSQIGQMEQQYKSLTGSRNLGDVFNNPALRNYLPGDWQTVYDSIRNGGYAGLSGPAKSLYDSNKVYDTCKVFYDTTQRLACEARAVKPAQDKSFALAAYEAAKTRMAQIDQLMGAINKTQDPKAIAELQARIGAEQAAIQNEQTKLQMYQMVADAEDRMQRQRQQEINAKVLSNREYAPLKITNYLAK
jgi:type IV secretion system protein VirB5